MKTLMKFRVYDKRNKRYLKGWKQATKHFIGIGNDPKDDTILSIAFSHVDHAGIIPDAYYEIERCDAE